MPISAVAGIFAKETGYGFAFNSPQDPAASLAAATAPRDPEKPAAAKDGNGSKRSARRTCRSSSSGESSEARQGVEQCARRDGAMFKAYTEDEQRGKQAAPPA